MESNRTKQRQFIKQTAFTAAMPTIISSTALGKGNIPAPSERVNLGFIGVGSRGSSLLRWSLGNKQAQVVAVSDCFESKRKNALKKLQKLTQNKELQYEYRSLFTNRTICKRRRTTQTRQRDGVQIR